MSETIYFSKVKSNAIIPSKLEENAGYDIYPCFDEDYIVIASHETKMIPTGIASACSSDYYFQLFERGSTGTKGIGQRCGVIDSGYRNEWFVPLTNTTNKNLIIIKDKISKAIVLEELFGTNNKFTDLVNNTIFYPYEKAICQAILLPVPKVNVEEVTYEYLKTLTSERGMGCLGSSNK